MLSRNVLDSAGSEDARPQHGPGHPKQRIAIGGFFTEGVLKMDDMREYANFEIGDDDDLTNDWLPDVRFSNDFEEPEPYEIGQGIDWD